jgi:hypothetical protein
LSTTAVDPRLHGPVRRRARRTPPLLKAFIVVAVLVVIGSFIKSRVSPRAPGTCLYGCGPSAGPAVPTTHTFTSTTFGFAFDYPAYWRPASGPSHSVANYVVSDSNGSLLSDFQVAAGTGNQQPSQLIAAKANSLGQVIQQLQSTGGMPGAQIGFTPGQGQFYRGSLVYSSGAEQPVEVAILSVQRSGEWVVVTGVSAYDSKKRAIANPDFDNALIRWRWTR